MDTAAALAFAADGATVASAGFNAAWFCARWLRQDLARRRFAAATLALLNAGIAVQAAFAQALYSAHRFDIDAAPLFASGPWLGSRAALLAGVVLLSVLILRRRP